MALIGTVLALVPLFGKISLAGWSFKFPSIYLKEPFGDVPVST
jgi:hypothetical protein